MGASLRTDLTRKNISQNKATKAKTAWPGTASSSTCTSCAQPLRWRAAEGDRRVTRYLTGYPNRDKMAHASLL
jgi:hypothetical protein